MQSTPQEPRSPEGTERRRGIQSRTVARVLLALTAVPLVVLIAGLVLLQFETVSTRVVNMVAKRANPWPDATLTAGVADIDGFGSLRLVDLRLASDAGEALATIDTLAVRVRPLSLLRGRLIVPHARIVGAEVMARQRADSTWDLLAPFAGPDTATEGGGMFVHIEDASITGSRLVARQHGPADSTLRIEGVELRLAEFRSAPVVLRVDTIGASIYPPTRPSSPALLSGAFAVDSGVLRARNVVLQSDSSNVHVGGKLVLPGGDSRQVTGMDFTVSARPLDFRDIGSLVPGFDVPGSLRFEATVGGSEHLITLNAEGRSFDGARFEAHGEFTPRTRDSVRYVLTAMIRDLDPRLWRSTAPPTDPIDGDLTVALQGAALDSVSGTASLALDRVTTASMTVEPTTINAEFSGGEARFTLDGGVAEWADIDASGIMRPFAKVPTYDVSATIARQRDTSFGMIHVRQAVARVSASGRGVAPDTATGRATVSLAGFIGRADLKATRMTASWDAGRASVTLESDLADAGSLTARGNLDWRGNALRVALDTMTVARLDVAALTSDSIQAIVTMHGVGAARSMTATAINARTAVVVEQFRWDSTVVDTARVTLALDDRDLTVHGIATSPAGRADFAVNARPFDDTPVWNLEPLTVTALNLAHLGDGMPESSIGSTLRATARGNALASLRVEGTLTARPSRIAGRSVDTATLSFTLADSTVDIHGTLRAFTGSARLTAMARPFALAGNGMLPRDTFPRIDAELLLEPMRIRSGRITSGRVTLQIENANARVVGNISTERGTIALTGTSALARTADSAMAFTNVAVNGTANLPDLGALLGSDTVPASLDARVNARASRLSFADGEWRATVAATGRYADATLDSMRVDARLLNDVLHLDTLMVHSNVVRGGGSGALVLADSATPPRDSDGLHVRLAVDSGFALDRALERRQVALRNADVTIDAQNADGGINVVARGNILGLISPGPWADSIGINGTARFENRTLTDLEGLVSAIDAGYGEAVIEAATANVTWDSTTARFEVVVSGDENHTARINGSAIPRERSLTFTQMNLGLGEGAWELAGNATVVWGPRTTVSDFVLRDGQRRIAIDGVIDRNGTQDFTVTLDSVPLRGFGQFAGIDDLDGTVQGELHLTGPASGATIEGSMGLDLLGTKGTIELSPLEQRRLAINARFVDAANRPFSVEGSVPLRISLAAGGDAVLTTGPLDLQMRADSFAIGWMQPLLSPAGVTRLAGTIDANVSVGGTFDQPATAGTASVRGALLEHRNVGVAYRNVRGDFSWNGDRIRIVSLTADADGRANISGSVLLETAGELRLDLHAELDSFHILRNEWADLNVSGQIDVTGGLQNAEVRGQLAIDETDIYADPIGRGTAGDPVELTEEDYRMLAQYFGLRPRQIRTERGLIDGWTMNIALAVGTDTWLRKRTAPELEILLDGSLDLRKAAGDSIQLFGTVEAQPQHSTFEQFGRRFRVQTGTATFNGPIGGWRANFGATYDVPAPEDPTASQVTITLNVSGTADDLALTLSSTPSMENADIVSYLAVGRPAASAAEFGGGSNFAESLAAGQLAAVIEDAAARNVGLDVVEVRQNGLKGATITAGRYVSSRLFVGFEQPLTLQSGNETETQTRQQSTEVHLEYHAYRWLVLSLQGDQSNFRFFFRARRAF